MRRPRQRANGTGSIVKRNIPGRSPWLAVVVVGWSPEGRPIRVSRCANSREEAEWILQGMVEGRLPKPVEWVRRRPKLRPKTRQPISARLRFEVLRDSGFACHYCGRRPPEITLHVDHVIPLIKGGTDARENLVAACAECNLGKSDR